MFLSQIGWEEIPHLTQAQKTRLVFDTVYDDGGTAPVAILLGCAHIPNMPERAEGALELYKAGRVKKIIPSGTVLQCLLPEKRLTEAEYMAAYLMERGVKEEDIFLENDARTTIENIICSQLVINRRFGNGSTVDVFVVSCPLHLRRSKLIAELYLPKNIRIHLYPCVSQRFGKENWMNSPEGIEDVEGEIRLLKLMIEENQCADIEF